MTASLKPHPNCGVCGVSAPRRVLLSPQIRQIMVDLARAHAPNETGGILVGRVEGDRVIVLAASDAGPRAIREPTRFERDGAYCQEFLMAKAAELGAGADYVGEWHSHPRSSACPSSRDTQSFVEIAADPNVLTTAPVLIIVAPQADAAIEWSATVFPVAGMGRAAQLEEA
jgi:integrative and conjugative element protein (TIGR02256 family)